MRCHSNERLKSYTSRGGSRRRRRGGHPGHLGVVRTTRVVAPRSSHCCALYSCLQNALHIRVRARRFTVLVPPNALRQFFLRARPVGARRKHLHAERPVMGRQLSDDAVARPVRGGRAVACVPSSFLLLATQVEAASPRDPPPPASQEYKTRQGTPNTRTAPPASRSFRCPRYP